VQIYSNEALVSTFVQSGVHRYLEFKCLDRLCLYSAQQNSFLPVIASLFFSWVCFVLVDFA
jgi:RAB protein geranylgeranyltransferase component A